jgi:hypothetical protein
VVASGTSLFYETLQTRQFLSVFPDCRTGALFRARFTAGEARVRHLFQLGKAGTISHLRGWLFETVLNFATDKLRESARRARDPMSLNPPSLSRNPRVPQTLIGGYASLPAIVIRRLGSTLFDNRVWNIFCGDGAFRLSTLTVPGAMLGLCLDYPT